MKGKSGTWYWNESVNKSYSDIEEERYSNVKEKDETKTREFETKIEKSKIQKEAMPDVSLRWNKDRKSSLCRKYGKRSKSFSQRLRKLARDFKKKVSQIYNIEALWQLG